MTKTREISAPPSTFDACRRSRATCVAAEASIAAAKETAARARQRIIDRREEVRAISRLTQAAVAATEELLHLARRAR
jgi:hypothetical protein